MRRTHRVKICGLTQVEDARRAVDLGAWALGMIFYRRSPRQCKITQAVEIVEACKRDVELCGVFVNPTLERIDEVTDQVGLTMIQLHGDEGPSFCAEAARRTGCKVVKAARVRSAADIAALSIYKTDYYLLDAFKRGVRGGTGETFNWELVRGMRAKRPIILSGGLTPENVVDAIDITDPFAVDVASGVESSAGIKDHGKLDRFFESVRSLSADQPLEEPAEREEREDLLLLSEQQELDRKRAQEKAEIEARDRLRMQPDDTLGAK